MEEAESSKEEGLVLYPGGPGYPDGHGLGAPHEGIIHISEDVIIELARKTIQGIPNIQAASSKMGAFGIGRRGDGIRVSVDPGGVGDVPSISVDVYVLVRYGQRIPDLAWDVQEKVKGNLERYTGYSVKAVNINVQGIYLEEPFPLDSPDPQQEGDEAEAVGHEG